MHLLATLAPGSDTSSRILARLVLPAGYACDDIARDLAENFNSQELAEKLCSDPLPFRGLPSHPSKLTPSEASLLPQLQPDISDLAALQSAREATHAASVTVFMRGEWQQLELDGTITPIREIPLVREQLPEKILAR